MPDATRKPVKFDRPPIVEVACGLSFELPKPLLTAHVGLYWSRVRDKFPNTTDNPPIAQAIEGPLTVSPSFELQVLELAPLRRTFFVTKDGRKLIQLQDDRFLFNWKRIDDGDHYPSYDLIIDDFHAAFADFIVFVGELGLGQPRVTQLELTYVNAIDTSERSASPSRLLIDHLRSDTTRFLPEPELVNWQTAYQLPDGAGRLHTTAQTARRTSTGQPMVRLDLTARGSPKRQDIQARKEWFDLAHHWITQGFADITSPSMQQQWGRTA